MTKITKTNIIAIMSVLIIVMLSYSAKVSTDEPTDAISLGEKLFFDPILSQNQKISCASCHIPQFAFADTLPFSIGVLGLKGKRNTPSAMNMASREIFFFDGRAATLEEQAAFPIQDHVEMNLNIDEAAQRVAKHPNYIAWFHKVYQSHPTKALILSAIAEYERSLETSSPFDDYMAGDTNAISASAKRGHALFMSSQTKCFDCHFTPDFTADEFKNIGLFDGKTLNDSGRYLISRRPSDIGSFKVPGLRNVAVTAPYMHHGGFKTLYEVVEYYNNIYKHVPSPINLDTALTKPLGLSHQDMVDLEAFLMTLTDKRFAGNQRGVSQYNKP